MSLPQKFFPSNTIYLFNDLIKYGLKVGLSNWESSLVGYDFVNNAKIKTNHKGVVAIVWSAVLHSVRSCMSFDHIIWNVFMDKLHNFALNYQSLSDLEFSLEIAKFMWKKQFSSLRLTANVGPFVLGALLPSMYTFCDTLWACMWNVYLTLERVPFCQVWGEKSKPRWKATHASQNAEADIKLGKGTVSELSHMQKAVCNWTTILCNCVFSLCFYHSLWRAAFHWHEQKVIAAHKRTFDMQIKY